MPLLTAEAVVPLPDPHAVLARLTGRVAELAAVTPSEQGAMIEHQLGRTELVLEAGALRLRVRCADASALAFIKMVLAEHLATAAGAPPAFAWTGHDAARREIPYFREMTVRAAAAVTPHMRRVVLAGDAAHYAGDLLHVRLLIPPAGRAPVWPHAAADGRIAWPEGADALTPRVYTVRHVDAARGEIALDVVLHAASGEAATPGSAWARDVRPGDRVGLLGPGGRRLAPADWYLLAGDETALPAIARMAEALPAAARAVLRIEVADAAEEQPIVSAAALDLAFLHRDGAAAGTTELLEQAVRAVPLPQDGRRCHVWVGCEQAQARRIRAGLAERGLDPACRSVAAYWRRGFPGIDVGD